MRRRSWPVLGSEVNVHLATSDVFPSPPSATKVKTRGRVRAALWVFAHASFRNLSSSSRPTSSVAHIR